MKNLIITLIQTHVVGQFLLRLVAKRYVTKARKQQQVPEFHGSFLKVVDGESEYVVLDVPTVGGFTTAPESSSVKISRKGGKPRYWTVRFKLTKQVIGSVFLFVTAGLKGHCTYYAPKINEVDNAY